MCWGSQQKGYWDLKGPWVPVIAVPLLPNRARQHLRFRTKFNIRPQPTEILSGAMPGCLRNPSGTLDMGGPGDIEPREQLKQGSVVRREWDLGTGPGRKFRRDFHTVLTRAAQRKEWGAQTFYLWKTMSC